MTINEAGGSGLRAVALAARAIAAQDHEVRAAEGHVANRLGAYFPLNGGVHMS